MDLPSYLEWLDKEKLWVKSLHKWLVLAVPYMEGIERDVLATPASKYDGKWTVSDIDFPNSDAVRKWKQHRIIQSNYMRLKPSIDERVRRAAFGGGDTATPL